VGVSKRSGQPDSSRINKNPFVTAKEKHKTPQVTSSKKRQIMMTNDKDLSDVYDAGMKF
jgi:hypothetical protein